MSGRRLEGLMTRNAASLALAMLLLLSAPALLSTAQAAPTAFTINVVSARDLGCSPDFWTSPDLRVHVYVNDAPVYLSAEASEQKEPTFALTIPVNVQLPATISVEVEEGEPSGFFGVRYEPCSVAAGGATRAHLTYKGESSLTFVTRGDDDRAAEVYLVVGTTPPPAPTVSASPAQTSVTLQWAADGSGQATGHRVARGGVGALVDAAMTGTSAVVGNLCDNSAYTFRVIRDTTTWHVSSADVQVRTLNAAPQPATVLSATREGNVSFDSPTTHDVARYEIHASTGDSFTPSSATLRHTMSPSFIMSQRVEATGIAFAASDTHVRVRVVDTGDLHADSVSFAIDGPTRSAPSGFGAACGMPSPSGSSTSGAATMPPPRTQEPEPTPEPTPEPERDCCYDLTWSFVTAISVHGMPQVEVGGTVELRLENTGTRPITVDASVVDRTGAVRFGPAINGFVQLDPGESQSVSVRVHAEPGTPARAGINAAIQLHLRESDQVHEAYILVDIPADGNEVFWLGDVQVLFPRGWHNVSAGASVKVFIHVTNHGERMAEVRFSQGPSIREATGGGLVTAPGYTARAERDVVQVAPYSQQEVLVTITTPTDAEAGAMVITHLQTGTSAGSSAYQMPVSFRVQVAQPVVASAAAAGLGWGVGATLAGAGVAGAGVAAALAARRDAWRFAIAATLYTRMARSETLNHAGRETLQQLITDRPGVCYTELKRATEMNTGAIVHHLRALERAGFVASRREGAYRRFYPAGRAPATLVQVAPALTPMQARVVELLRASPLTQGQLAEALGLSQQGTSHHVKTLERAGRIEVFYDGRVWRYRVLEATHVPR